jgi:hypothetical protein
MGDRNNHEWISLTYVQMGSRREWPVTVRVAHILYYEGHGEGGTVLTFARRHWVHVVETPGEVARKIEGLEKMGDGRASQLSV